jgi:glutamate/tyrosine decarboxylase-like PLP-dependent enzyme
MELSSLVAEAVRQVEAWQARWGDFDPHPAVQLSPEALAMALRAYTDRLHGNYPFFHPRYAGQMIKPPHPVAVLGYVAAQVINPNNHALDGGPPTGQMEKEVVRDLAAMFHFPEQTLGHLTGGGTVANLEALWIARELHPDQAVAFSEAAHYTHGRMSQVLRMGTRVLPVDAGGRLDPTAVEAVLRTGQVGTLVATAGTTALGVVDPIDDLLPLCRRYGVRLHVDAAYGGFFTILAWAEDPLLAEETRRHYRAIAAADSIAIDPHKHGLQPYGCGAVLFRDPAAGRFYRHDSPYTYFTSDELHLGEISLECSRPGAAAGALWLTLRLLPLTPEGLGAVLAAGLRAARHWQERVTASAVLRAYVAPELDIVTFYPAVPQTASALDTASQHLFDRAMHDPDNPIFLSLLRVAAASLPGLVSDQPQVRILRSVLMKPEHETYVETLFTRLTGLL